VNNRLEKAQIGLTIQHDTDSYLWHKISPEQDAVPSEFKKSIHYFHVSHNSGHF